MSNEIKNNLQSLSELMDDYVSDEAIEQLLANEEQAESWYRYQVVRSVLNQDYSAHCSYQFTQAISKQIAMEPAIIAAPKKASVSFISRAWKKSGGGLAIAASVAFAMVFSVQMMDSGNNADFNNSIQTATNDSTFKQLSQKLLTPKDDDEQAELDEIQRVLDSMNRSGFQVNEQLVGGPVMVKSFVVKTNNKFSDFESEIRRMKKPSEFNEKD